MKRLAKDNSPKLFYSIALAIAVATCAATTIPANASETDDRIESSFKNSFVYERYLKDDQIKIKSKDGVVTLSGVAPNETDKTMARTTAEALPGVKSVHDRIEIQKGAPAEKSDAWIATKIKSTLLFHRNVNAHGTTVSVKDGVATLKGEAATRAQKELTTEYAKDIEGVKDVNNEMTVAGASSAPNKTVGEKIDDASITALVKMTLMFHRSTGVLRTTVKTNDGVVTLAGKARNSAERDLATQLAEDVHGVKTVTNNMTFEQAKNN